MDNQFVKYVNGTNATDMHNTSAVDVSTITQTVEPKNYLVTLQQADGSTHTLQLTEEELDALGLETYFLTSNDATSKNTSNYSAEQSIDPLIGQTKPVSDQQEPLGSSENPIQIIQNGNTLSTTQNVSESHLKVIADVLLSKQKRVNGVDNNEDIVYRVVYPEELNLKPVLNKPKKCGRPKKKAAVVNEETSEVVEEESPIPTKSARTRSGRIIRPPRHIEKDFKKIDVSDKTENEVALKTTEFTTPTEKETEQPKVFQSLPSTSRKRAAISSKYRCPKCQKVYLGRIRMVKHLEDNPDHGPIPEYCKTNNSEVWNYLVDITQKYPTGKRGSKFCEELSNLLQNLRVLSRFLFKLSDEKNTVALDTFLGSVLDLPPGNYRFNESELHKDVTIFKMLNDMRLFENANKRKSSSIKTNSDASKSIGNDFMDVVEHRNDVDNKTEVVSDNFVNCNNSISKEKSVMDAFSVNEVKAHNGNEKPTTLDNVVSLHNELLCDNSPVIELPNLRTSVDDLILPVMNNTNVSQLLDTTASSDEAINVDQFVNERLKTIITESDIDLSGTALSLDLSTLDLYQFSHS